MKNIINFTFCWPVYVFFKTVGCYISEVKEITSEQPQGSALSSVLFNIFTVGISSKQLEGPGRTLSFAAYVLSYYQGKDSHLTASALHEELYRIDKWCDENNGKLHQDKANVLWCSLNNRVVSVNIAGKFIKRVYHLRYLGID